MRFVWIDDNPERRELSDALAEGLGVDCDFVDVVGKDLSGELVSIKGDSPPDLIILDHVLDKTAAESRVLGTGSSVAAVLREWWPSCPIVGITAARKRPDIDMQKERAYEELFSADQFRRTYSCVAALASGFAGLGKPVSNAAGLCDLFAPPQDDSERLLSALPDDVKSGLADRSLASRLYSWSRDFLFGRPGFLHDRLWAATLVGLKESSFGKVTDIFKSAEYSGIFACSYRERWWSTSVRQAIYRACDTGPGEMPWELGCRLEGIGKRDLSKCYACGGDFPETVAYVDEASDERHPMHIGCTEPHPNYQDILLFDQIRMLAGDKE